LGSSENQKISTTPKFADGGEKNITPTIFCCQDQFLVSKTNFCGQDQSFVVKTKNVIMTI
jgi:hypothetical protein